MPMNNPPHPGLSVRHDCLEPLGLSVTEAARKLGVSRKQLSDIVNCRSGISPEMAIRLDKAFGGGGRHMVPASVRMGTCPGKEECFRNPCRANSESNLIRLRRHALVTIASVQADGVYSCGSSG